MYLKPIRILSLVCGIFCYSAMDAQPRLPNVLWLDLEDISPMLSMYGDSTIETPNIDRLAREGVTFANAYATVGVCAPSRASIITGMFPVAIGAHNMRIQAKSPYAAQGVPEYEIVPPADVRCFPDLLREKGVYTICSNKTDYQFSPSPFTWDLFENNEEADRKWFHYPQPFFKQINFWETHESQIWDWCRINVPLLIDSSKVKVPPYLPRTPGTRMDWITQYNNLKYTDNKIGDIMKVLEQSGLLDKTIIILTGDHGNGLPRGKRTVYESGVKVPMIIRFPDKRHGGTRNEEPAYLMDLGPTILSMYGIAPPTFIHGRDLLGSFKPSVPRQYLFFSADRFDEKSDMIRAVSNGRFKYIRYFQPKKPQFLEIAFRKRQDGVKDLFRLDSLGQLPPYAMAVMRKTKPTEELFDIVNDPHELNNLAKNSKFKSVMLELKLALDQWMQDIQDLGFTPEKDIAGQYWPGGQHPITETPEIRMENGMVNLICTSPGATIGYTINQLAGWTIYTKPFAIKNGDTITVMAHRLGYKSSDIVKQTPKPN